MCRQIASQRDDSAYDFATAYFSGMTYGIHYTDICDWFAPENNTLGS